MLLLKYAPLSAMLLVVAQLTLAQAPPSVPSTQPAATPARDIQSVLARLGSDDFAIRQSAQKELETLTWRQHDLLKQLVDSAADPEIKARLSTRLASLEEQMILDPPSISLDVTDATIMQVQAALTKSMGIPIEPYSGSSINRTLRFTLSIKDAPFWEVFSKLNDQHTLRFANNGVIMNPTVTTHVDRIIGPILIHSSSATARPGMVNIGTTLCIDPRIKILQQKPPQFLEVVDNAGTVLQPRNPPAREDEWRATSMHGVQTGRPCIAPEVLGKTISFKGVYPLIIQLAADSVTVPLANEHLDKPIHVKDHTITISRGTKTDEYKLTINHAHAGPAAPARPLAAEPPDLNYLVYSPEGLIMSGGAITSGATPRPVILEPGTKIEFSVPTKTKEVALPFELKDLPIQGS